jgi:uncharacterized membrane protein
LLGANAITNFLNRADDVQRNETKSKDRVELFGSAGWILVFPLEVTGQMRGRFANFF